LVLGVLIVEHLQNTFAGGGHAAQLEVTDLLHLGSVVVALVSQDLGAGLKVLNFVSVLDQLAEGVEVVLINYFGVDD
jgi:hypothetical protein